MKRLFANRLRQIKEEESGSLVLIEFVILFPIMLLVFMTCFEFGFYQFRQVFLERGLDLAVRDVRLNTSTKFTHSQLKLSICNYAGFLEDCDDELKLQMSPIDVRTFPGGIGETDCSDTSQPVQPVRQFKNGVQHQLMVLRACYKFQPVFPQVGLGAAFYRNADGGGRSAMVAISAFVQEP